MTDTGGALSADGGILLVPEADPGITVDRFDWTPTGGRRGAQLTHAGWDIYLRVIGTPARVEATFTISTGVGGMDDLVAARALIDRAITEARNLQHSAQDRPIGGTGP